MLETVDIIGCVCTLRILIFTEFGTELEFDSQHYKDAGNKAGQIKEFRCAEMLYTAKPLCV